VLRVSAFIKRVLQEVDNNEGVIMSNRILKYFMF
jgi:hypothetical protein